MNISKTNFLELIKLNKKISSDEMVSILSMLKSESKLEDLMSLESSKIIIELLDSMYQDNNEDESFETTANIDLQHEMMLPYYNHLEILSGRAIRDKFGGNVRYSLKTFNQKRFEYEKEGYTFYAFLDGYQEDSDTIRIFETKATTSSKFSKDKFNFQAELLGDNKNTKLPFFFEDSEGVFIPHEVIGLPDNSKYYKREQTLFNKESSHGKYIYDLAYQKYIVDNAVKTNKKIEYYLVVLNHEYIYDGKKDEKGKPIYSNDIVRFYNITSILNKMMPMMKRDINKVIKIVEDVNNNEYDFDKVSKDLDFENSINVYVGRHHGFTDNHGEKRYVDELIDLGYTNALDIPESWLTRPNNIIQRKVIESGKPYYNYKKIRKGIKELKYPIYHLDFESFNCPLPRFKGESPYTQSVFQYSIHVEHEPGKSDKELDHYGYLAKDHNDNRLELLESMLDVIKDDGGSVLVYNIGFERGRLIELQKYYPQYKQRLQNIIDRLFDLMYIVKTNNQFYQDLGFDEEEAKEFNFYHNDLQGSFSIKKVLPIFSNLKYDDLLVQDGMQAMVAYHSFPTLEKEEFEKQYKALIEYCKQDTWAMFEILDEFRKL